MCGIFAVLSRKHGIDRDYATVLSGLRHRGPDDIGQQAFTLGCDDTPADERAWLGHTRLSIIDLSVRGHQPMESSDRRYAITYNGEIYNFVELRAACRAAGESFSSDSDTEVLLAAWRLWGEACLCRLKGMFAFVVLDRHAGTATIVRDFFGIKPLYYSLSTEALAISSEVMPLVASGHATAQIRHDVAYEYLRFGATGSNDRTILRDVQSLPAAHLAVFDFRTGELSPPRPYWHLRATSRAIGFKDATVECRERFLENVRLHLRSDVPVGAALSGGIDSSAIVCAMRIIEPDLDLRTFSYIASEPGHSEERWVDLVHQHVGGTCEKIRPSAIDVASELEILVRRQGEPFGSASMFAQFQVFRAARAAGVTVTLDGQGADELLGGYYPYVGTVIAAKLRRGNVGAALRVLLGATSGLRDRAKLVALTAQSVLPSRARALARRAVGRELVPSYFDRQWMESAHVGAAESAEILLGRFGNLKEHLIDTVERGSLPNLLRYADRNSMAFAVESRVPFLTHDFAEFMMSLPAEYLISSTGVRKHVFREAMRDILPDPIRRRTDKIGFFADDSAWLRGSRHRFMHVWSELSTFPMFERRSFERFLSDFWTGRHDKAALVWRALVFGLWHRELVHVSQQA
jgi:asparagine synthase (glutamine-hydrolysing)